MNEKMYLIQRDDEAYCKVVLPLRNGSNQISTKGWSIGSKWLKKQSLSGNLESQPYIDFSSEIFVKEDTIYLGLCHVNEVTGMFGISTGPNHYDDIPVEYETIDIEDIINYEHDFENLHPELVLVGDKVSAIFKFRTIGQDPHDFSKDLLDKTESIILENLI